MPGRPFLQIPGPTLVPERIVRAMSQSIIDHRGPAFAGLVRECLDGLKGLFQTEGGHILLFPGSGTGAWEVALVNTLSPGDRVLACVNGHFSAGFAKVAAAYGIECDRLEVSYGDGIAAADVETRLRADSARQIRAVLVVHNETSTGVTSDIAAIRRALTAAGHPALLLVDTVSSLASIDFRMDEWGVDVALTGPQKGLMLPPGLAIVAASQKAVDASEKAKCPRSYWDWAPVIERNRRGEYPYTPAIALLFGLRESLAMLSEEVALHGADGDGGWSIKDSVGVLGTPPTIQALFRSRLDQLPVDERRVLGVRLHRGPSLSPKRAPGPRSRVRAILAGSTSCRARPQGPDPSRRAEFRGGRGLPLPPPPDPRGCVRITPEGDACRSP